MNKINEIEIAVIGSSYRKEITEELVKNCLITLKENNVSNKNINLFNVPGALEIPLLAKKLAKSNKYDAIIVFGSVYKGKTYHFEQVADECVRGCMNVSYEYEIPVVFEVLCVYSPEDAVYRASAKGENRGKEGALTALKMIKILNEL